MKRRYSAFWALAGLCLLAAMQISVGASNVHGTLKVKLHYTGAGIANESHRIYILLFDSNPFTASSLVDSTSDPTPPASAAGVSHILRRLSAAGKDAIVTFTNLTFSPVYAAAFLDRNGSYDGHSDPAAGSSLGAYEKAPDKIAPIKLQGGKIAEIVIAFDDSLKTP